MISLILAILCFCEGYTLLGIWASIWSLICFAVFCFKVGQGTQMPYKSIFEKYR